MKGSKLTLTDVKTDGTLSDVSEGDSFEILQTWQDHLGNTRASVGTFYKGSDLVKESHTVIISRETVTFAPSNANINTVAYYEME
jgi:hypothetical protein